MGVKLTLREEHRLRVFGNRVLKKMFGPNKDEVIGGGESCIMRNFLTCMVRQV
jgi:hypothetical protein